MIPKTHYLNLTQDELLAEVCFYNQLEDDQMAQLIDLSRKGIQHLKINGLTDDDVSQISKVIGIYTDEKSTCPKCGSKSIWRTKVRTMGMNVVIAGCNGCGSEWNEYPKKI